MRTKKNKLLKRGRAVALAAVLFCTLIFGTMAVVPPIRAEAASINGLPINQKLQTINASSRYGNGIKYIVVHYTGAPGSAANNATYFSTGYRGRPPTILSGIPERSGRVCLTVWRPGR